MIWTFRENIRNTTLFGRICATEFRNICYFWVDMRNWGKVEIYDILRIAECCSTLKMKIMKKILLTAFLSLVISALVQGQTLHIYGGNNHDVYLGCLNCNKYDKNSIWNAYGTYGSKYNSNSIWNAYGTYGSKYNSASPWNSYSNDPPVIVDKDGGFYGYFTTKKYKSKRADFDLVEVLYEYHELIRDDVSKWYDKIFE